MKLTLIEKILLNHLDRKKWEDFLYPEVDLCFGNDITAPLAVKEFNKYKFKKVFNPKKIAFFCDHFLPARDLKAANNVKLLKEFSYHHQIKNFYDISTCGIEHIFVLEKGLIKPGNLVVGADSHTCTAGAVGAAAFGVGSTDLAAAMYEGRAWIKKPKVIKFVYKGKLKRWVGGKDIILHTIGRIGVSGALYKVMEFSGETIKKLPLEERLTLTNMAIEAGAQTGIIEPDEKTLKFLQEISGKNIKVNLDKLKSDKGASYEDIIEIDISRLNPSVACPHLPSEVKDVEELKKVKLTQVFIGSCTNGKLSDIKTAASILQGKKVKKGLRVVVIPATPRIYKVSQKRGYLKALLEAGCIICPPNCGPCLGGHMGVLNKGEIALSTTNRNFIGRMGSSSSYVYLASAAVAAASAIKGRIASPYEVM